MDKVYGSPKRQDGLYKIGREKYELIYGFGEDEQGGWNYRQRFNYLPTAEDVKRTIEAQINADTDSAILSGFVWNGKPVWLSSENQMNFKAAYDIARDTDSANLPVKFKLGEDADGKPVYHTFTKLEPLADFISKVFAYINKQLNDGWTEKDGIDYSTFEIKDEC